MLIKLTESGLKLFGVGGDQAVKNVNNDRAYHLMVNGHANKDSRFMAMYEANRAKEIAKAKAEEEAAEAEAKAKAEEEAAVEEKPKSDPKPTPKKERATSKKAATRERAVKE